MSTTLQGRTLRLYGELLAHAEQARETWPGKLVLGAGAGASSTGLMAAACIAGATCLVVDPDAKAVRATLRDGGVDFVVNTLDEALRVLKNEVRQRRPLGVALTADVEQVREEMAERGVVADLAVNAEGFAARAELQLADGVSEALAAWLARRGWTEQTVEELPVLEAGDPRGAWLRGIVRYQRSATREPRVLWV